MENQNLNQNSNDNQSGSDIDSNNVTPVPTVPQTATQPSVNTIPGNVISSEQTNAGRPNTVPPGQARSRGVVPPIIFIVPLFCFILAGFFFVEAKLPKSYVKTTAVASNSGCSTADLTFKDQPGRTYTTHYQESGRGCPQLYSNGDSVTVAYNPSNPGHAIKVDPGNSKMMGYIMVVIGIILAAIFAKVLYWPKHSTINSNL